MNALTRRIVTETAQANKAAAKANGQRFADLMQAAWWSYLIGTYGWRMQQKMLAIAKTKCKQYFDEEGYLLDHIPEVYDFEVAISNMVCNRLEERAERDPELRLDGWGDLPRKIVEPQMELF